MVVVGLRAWVSDSALDETKRGADRCDVNYCQQHTQQQQLKQLSTTGRGHSVI